MPPSFLPPRTPTSGESMSRGAPPPASMATSAAQRTAGEQSSLGSASPAPPAAALDHFADALDAALALTQADGGELALLDGTRQIMVVRARRTRPQADGSPRPPGLPARGSQPLVPGVVAASPALTTQAQGADDDIGGQETQVLPAASIVRVYQRGERLVGQCWLRAAPLLASAEQCRSLPAGSAPPEPDAAQYLAVPLFRPASLSTTRPNTEVIGVLLVYHRNPSVSFSRRDLDLLTLHADRITRALVAADLARQVHHQAELQAFLDASSADTQETYLRVREIVRRTLPAPTFALLLLGSRHDEVHVHAAEVEGRPEPEHILAATNLPQWWRDAREGRTTCLAAPEDRTRYPKYTSLGFSETPAQSLLVAPLATPDAFLGVLLAATSYPNSYGAEHLHLFSALARSAALVIQNRQLADRSSAKAQQLAKLNNALLAFHGSLDLETAAHSLAEQAHSLTHAAACAVFLLDDAGEQFFSAAEVGVHHTAGEPFSATRIPLAWQDLGNMLEQGRILPLTNLEEEWRDGSPFGRFLARQQIKSCLVLPLVHPDPVQHNGGRLGILMIYTPGETHRFMAEEMGLLQGLASQGAVAIHNARLFGRLADELEKQKELDRLKDDFILTVSHEFRTPVTAIEGYVTLIQRHGDKLDHDRLARFADEIHQAATQLTNMIGKLNDINSWDQGKQPAIITGPVNIRQAAKQAIDNLPPESTARLVTDIAPTLWAIADGERLPTVFSNLLSNAVKYSPQGSPVRVTAWVESREALAEQQRAVALAPETAEQFVVVSVRDFGEGIPDDEMGRLFHKFVRLSRSLTTSVRGTGLGLWICKKYIEAMGGEIWVESEFGSGADFRFCLRTSVAPAPDGG